MLNLRGILVSALAALTLSASAQRGRIELGGDWNTEMGVCVLPGTTDQSRLGKESTRKDLTSRLTRLYEYTGKLRYEKDIVIPREMAGNELLLVMERTKPSTLWVDGDSIGHYTHIYAPHKYILGPLAEGKHHIAIDVDNSLNEVPRGLTSSHAYSSNTQTNWNGILGEFYIESLPNTYIEDIQVYPDVESRKARVLVKVHALKKTKVDMNGILSAWNASKSDLKDTYHELDRQTFSLKAGSQTIETEIYLGDKVLLWSEFHPALYKLQLTVGEDTQTADFGLRNIKVENNRITVNGNKIFLRGRHDALVFPLTGYPPMDLESWIEYFQTSKQYGINHHRFHSCAPPKAAFMAADIVGIYLQPEIPMWGSVDPAQKEINEFMLREGRMLFDYVGNSPSFFSFGLGNELSGDIDEMRRWLDVFRAHDMRHLYVFGSNNFLGRRGQLKGEDMLITCRTNNPDGTMAQVRASFSFADEPDGGIINGTRPKTNRDYSYTAKNASLPIIGHETGQFQFFPDYGQIEKYTGVLYPYNLEVFRSRLDANGLEDQQAAFRRANNAFAMECYKEDIEYYLRSEGIGGFEMLDLQDYPGQGTALVGILDAFMDSKGAVTPETFRGYCSELVAMARMDDMCYWNDQNLHFDIVVSNYTEDEWRGTVTWNIASPEGWSRNGSFKCMVPQGEVGSAGAADLDLSSIGKATRLVLTLNVANKTNYYHIWVYPRHKPDSEGITIVRNLDDGIKARLDNGEKVLLIPSPTDSTSVGGLFIPDYWNFSMFKGICERGGKPVSPGTLGLLVDPSHPLFGGFPTGEGSDWQWWGVSHASKPMILNSLKGYKPIIQVIDNIERNHRLGILFEFKVGGGSILICTCDLDKIKGTPEGDAFSNAIFDYIRSDSFKPSTTISWSALNSLLTTGNTNMEAAEVDTAADYSVK